MRPIGPIRPIERLAGLWALLAAWVLAACGRAAEPPPAGDSGRPSMMQEASQRIAAWPAVSAKLRQRVDLFGQQLVGSGVYLQKRSPGGPLLRLELKLDVGGTLSSLQQVCDGRFLSIRRVLPGGTTVGRVDLSQIRAAIDRSGRQAWTDASTNWMALGGLPRLLASVTEHFVFSAPQPNRVDNTPVWTVEGRWKQKQKQKEKHLASLSSEQNGPVLAGAPVDATQAPPHLPDRVLVVLRKDDLFPVRIDFRRSASDARNSGGSSGGESQSMVVLEFLEILVPARLDDSQFQYQPGKEQVVDHTELYLQTLKWVPE